MWVVLGRARQGRAEGRAVQGRRRVRQVRAGRSAGQENVEQGVCRAHRADSLHLLSLSVCLSVSLLNTIRGDTARIDRPLMY